MRTVRLLHDGGARKQASFVGFAGQYKVLLRYAGVCEFSLCHGYGLGVLDRWHIHPGDLEQLRKDARASGMRFAESPRPGPRALHTQRVPQSTKQRGLFE